VQRLNWGSYKIDKNNDKIGIFVSIVSTKIPFKGTSKEYIGDDNVDIAEAVDRAIRACAIQLKGKISRAQAAKEKRARKKVLQRYIPDVSRAIAGCLKDSAAFAEPPHKRANNNANAGTLWEVDLAWEKEILDKVRNGQVTAATLARKLEDFVESMDSEQALEHSMQNKEGLTDAVHLMNVGGSHEFAPIVYHPALAFKGLKASVLGKHPQR
jgi:hypothetical protein